MDSIKWKCKNWIVHFKKFDNFYLIHFIVKKLDVFNLHPIFCYCYHIYVQDLNTFFKKNTSKLGILQRRKTIMFLIIKMSAKSNKIQLSQEFMAIWRKEQTLWDIMFPLHPRKMKKTKV